MAEAVESESGRRAARKKKPRLHPMLKWLRGAGVSAELFGWGGLLFVGWFWPAVASIYVGFLLLAVDLWFEPNLRDRRSWRYVGVALMAVLAGAFTWGIVLVKAPLDVSAFMTDAEYPPGTTIAGIVWRPQFTEVQVWITNPAEKSYDDLDVVIRPTSAIPAIAQVTNLPGVSFEDKNGLSVRMADVDLGGKRASAVPLVLLGTDAGYKVRCLHLPPKSTLKLVLALADIKWAPRPNQSQIPLGEQVREKDYILRFKFDDFSTYWQGHPDGDVYAPRPTSTEWMKVEGTYTTAQRTRYISQKIDIGGKLTIR